MHFNFMGGRDGVAEERASDQPFPTRADVVLAVEAWGRARTCAAEYDADTDDIAAAMYHDETDDNFPPRRFWQTALLSNGYADVYSDGAVYQGGVVVFRVVPSGAQVAGDPTWVKALPLPDAWHELVPVLEAVPVGTWVRASAWAVGGGDPTSHDIMIDGGRAVYEAAWCVPGRRGDRVRLSRLDTDPLREVVRYVDPDTVLRVRRRPSEEG